MKFNLSEEEKKSILNQHKLLSEQSGGNPLVYSQVIEVPNTTKDILYDKLKQWMATAYKNFSKVVQLDDKNAGTMVGQANMSFQVKSFSMTCSTGYVNYTIKLFVKDNKFKIEMSQMEHQARAGSVQACSLGFLTDSENYKDKGLTAGPYNKVWVQLKQDTKTYFDGLVENLQNDIKNIKSDDFNFKP